MTYFRATKLTECCLIIFFVVLSFKLGFTCDFVAVGFGSF